MARPDGRVEAGQSLKRAISAKRWNDLCDAADIVHGRRGGVTATAGQRNHVLAKTTGEWTKGTSQALNIYAGPQGSEVETSDQVQAWNRFADIADDKWVMLARVGAAWYVISAEC